MTEQVKTGPRGKATVRREGDEFVTEVRTRSVGDADELAEAAAFGMPGNKDSWLDELNHWLEGYGPRAQRFIPKLLAVIGFVVLIVLTAFMSFFEFKGAQATFPWLVGNGIGWLGVAIGLMFIASAHWSLSSAIAKPAQQGRSFWFGVLAISCFVMSFLAAIATNAQNTEDIFADAQATTAARTDLTDERRGLRLELLSLPPSSGGAEVYRSRRDAFLARLVSPELLDEDGQPMTNESALRRCNNDVIPDPTAVVPPPATCAQVRGFTAEIEGTISEVSGSNARRIEIDARLEEIETELDGLEFNSFGAQYQVLADFLPFSAETIRSGVTIVLQVGVMLLVCLGWLLFLHRVDHDAIWQRESGR